MTLEDYEYQHTRFITCPYCGHKEMDSWEYADMKGDCEIDCPQCEKPFILLQPEIEINYTTKPIV